jgi:hypothetical protein
LWAAEPCWAAGHFVAEEENPTEHGYLLHQDLCPVPTVVVRRDDLMGQNNA